MNIAPRRRLPFVFGLVIFASLLMPPPQVYADLINGSFELPDPGSLTNANMLLEASVPGWKTTAADGRIELWSNNFLSVPAYHGKQHAELNANLISTLYQDVDASGAGITNGSILHFGFAHRGRLGLDTMKLTITDLGADNAIGGTGVNLDTALFFKNYSTNNTAWAYYTDVGELPIVALGNNLRFAYESISSSGGDNSFGNFIDYASFGLSAAPPAVPEPGTMALVGLGAFGLVAGAIRRRRLQKIAA